MRDYPSIGIRLGDILLPKSTLDMQKWAVIACDQFTSEPEYWDQVEQFVDQAPSTFHLILPEVYLETDREKERLYTTQANMYAYQEKGLFTTFDGLILVERTFNGKTRHGMMLALDLECYDFNKGSTSLIRATEGTILDRLPPRIKIREGAPLEFPHILVLIDDPEKKVIENLVANKEHLDKIYDFDLMLGSGHLRGYHVDNQELEQQVVDGLTGLSSAEEFEKKYQVSVEKGILLFAMGDGNHSLATAKAIWEKRKTDVGMDHPSRYALVEIENVHDEGLEFEPIHRVLFNTHADFFKAASTYFEGEIAVESLETEAAMNKRVREQTPDEQVVGVITNAGFSALVINKHLSNLPVGSLQLFLDKWLKDGGFDKIDYVHGEDATVRLGKQSGNVGLILPPMQKSDLFKTVILDGALPRKTFSMGEAKEKRFYMEGRKISS